MRGQFVLTRAFVVIAAMTMAACAKPDEESLRESFARQLEANRFVKDFRRSGDELMFSGPGAEGGTATWRVRVDAVIIQPTEKSDQPFKGTVKSSWYSDNQIVLSRGRESNLPIELIDNGLGQECWAFWNAATKRWSWE